MPSRYNTYNPDLKISQGSGAKPTGPGKAGSVNEKTAAWPGLPGKAQPRSRDGGTPKCRIYPKSEGL